MRTTEQQIKKAVDVLKNGFYFDLTGDLLAEAALSIQEEANEDYIGECKIWIEYCYSAGTFNHPNDGYCQEDYEDMIFDSCAAAKDYINGQTDGIYYLSHGEMGAPVYIIMQA